MFRTTTAMATIAAVMSGATAMAGNVDEPAPDPVIAAPAPVIQSSPDWTGFYAGGQLGYANVDPDNFDDDDGAIGGLVLGYDHDLGNNWVVGGGLDYDFADIDIGPNSSIEEVFRAKLRGGYKIGRGLLYGTGGYAWADTDSFGNEDGYFIGGGYEHLVTDNVSVGGEVLYHEFDEFSAATGDTDVTTVQVKATYRF